MKKFWNWTETRNLELYGTIADESWFDDDITPAIFRDELYAGEGDITVWINSAGGDCVAAAQIFNMLKEYQGQVTVKIDGLAASAASVVAMAGDKVYMSPVSTMMIHNPVTFAAGDTYELASAKQMLDEVKESIINAYEMKTGLSRREISKLMDSEYWMNANAAVEKGFADGILYQGETEEETGEEEESTTAVTNKAVRTAQTFARIPAQNKLLKQMEQKAPKGRSVDELLERLALLK